jgi:class 3 adenylate cyclase
VEDVDRAREAVEELETTVNDFNSAPLRASALCARGALQLAEGDSRAAVSTLRRGWRMWKEADLPYEAAQARMTLGAALRADGDEEAAVMEIRAARSAFERLGAIIDLRRATESLGEQAQNDLPKAPVPGERVVKTFMFTDIVSSTNLVEAMGDEAWESLLGWHDQTLRKLFTNHCGEEVKQIGDGFFVAFDDATDAMECAVQIQRQLGEHRKQHGFAPQVRIGLHQAEATRKGQDYGGKGVHTAARIGALAQGGEIIASTQVIENASRHRFPVSEHRSVSLKGVSEPAEVVSVQL